MVSPGRNDEMKLAGQTTNRPSNPLNQVAYLPVPIAAFESWVSSGDILHDQYRQFKGTEFPMEGQTSSYVLGHERCLTQESLTAMIIVVMQEVGGTQVDHSGRLGLL